MKKYLFIAVIILTIQQAKTCSWYDPDYEYFNIFTQEIIPNKSYMPFLLVYSKPYYQSENFIPVDENIVSWQEYFNNIFDYTKMDAIVKLVDIKHLRNLKKGEFSHPLFKGLPKGFYSDYKDGIDYLIEAKYLEPYMRVIHQENDSNWYYEKNNNKPITELNYDKVSHDLKNLYNATINNEIKLRYGFQIVRFQHYNRKYKEALEDFDTYVDPLQNDSPIYWSAVDQKAGAERGLGMLKEANWDFFQVFIHRANNKDRVYSSMKLTNNDDFNTLLGQCTTNEEKNMAYFLLAYNGFSNPLPLMKKMNEIEPNSDILKVLLARSINEIERSYLPKYYSCNNDNCAENESKIIPFYTNQNAFGPDFNEEFLENLMQFLNSTDNSDEFWVYSKAYLYFLKQDFRQSQEFLSQMNSSDPVYKEEFHKLRALNDILGHEIITTEFEEELYRNYGKYFELTSPHEDYNEQNTTNFVRDVLANRYFLQGDHAKSFLLNNLLSDLQYNPNVSLVQEVEKFFLKPNKNSFEKFIAKSFDEVGNTSAFFNIIYGDQAMRNASFAEAKQFYQKAQNFKGIHRYEWYTLDNENQRKRIFQYSPQEYDGYKNIPNLIFGHNVWESFESPVHISMESDGASKFPFIHKTLNKLQLADIALQLENIGASRDENSALANQLIGNLLYNTSILGYFRHIFVMDINNENGPKFHFQNEENPFHIYFKNYSSFSFIKPDNFDLSIQYYQKALDQAENPEQKARLLFQMASAEQGKYYQWEAKNYKQIDYNDPDYSTKVQEQDAYFLNNKFENYRTYFAKLKSDYSNTKTFSELQSSCLYFDIYLKQ